MFDTDVFVLGGGPAGLAAAIAARMAGLRVILADAQLPSIDKACGEGLMPDALAAATRLGISLSPALGFAFRGIRFSGASRQVAADFPHGSGIGIRRPLLHSVLVERAAQLGVEMLWGQSVGDFQPDSLSVGKRRISARWMVGADGTQSGVRRWAGLQQFRRDSQRFSRRRHYRMTPWSPYMQIHWGEGCQFYVTPVAADEVCLVLMTRDPQARIDDMLPHFAELHGRVRGAEAITSERGALAATRKVVHVTKGNIALIGDASGTVDPITGEGLCLAFKQACALAEAFVQNDLSRYEHAHARLSLRPRFMADFMLLLDRSSLLRRRVLAAFESHPQLFSNLLAGHVGQLTPVRFVATAAALGWQAVTA